MIAPFPKGQGLLCTISGIDVAVAAEILAKSARIRPCFQASVTWRPGQGYLRATSRTPARVGGEPPPVTDTSVEPGSSGLGSVSDQRTPDYLVASGDSRATWDGTARKRRRWRPHTILKIVHFVLATSQPMWSTARTLGLRLPPPGNVVLHASSRARLHHAQGGLRGNYWRVLS